MKTQTNKLLFLTALAAIVAIGGLLVSPVFFDSARSDDPAEIDGECLDCHDDAAMSLMGTGHDLGVGNSQVSCVNCHTGAEAHLDDEDVLPFNPYRGSVVEVAQTCVSCHPNSHSANQLERDPHADGEVNCTGCHKVHDNEHTNLLKHEEPELCFSCHAGVETDFSNPYRHPVKDGVVKCSDCHRELWQSHKQFSYAGTSAPCIECHGRFRGPFPFEHQASVDYSTEEGGCLNCHAAHGSTQPRMLKQPYESPNFATCAQCHVVPLHQSNSQHGTAWAGLPCADCHVDIHGSYTNRNFLRTSLQVEGCFNSGCHEF